jgi:hypothetical protein
MGPVVHADKIKPAKIRGARCFIDKWEIMSTLFRISEYLMYPFESNGRRS